MNYRNKNHKISKIVQNSIAEELGMERGDRLLEIGGEVPEDIFDYQYMILNEYIELLVEKPDGEQWLLEIDKEETEDLGLEFENGLMDEYRSCQNKCIFCFIDQMPRGMRETLYFKDDDSRLSFLQGNYVTLTNMSDQDIDRIIKYRLSPINISFHTTNPKLRCRMLGNRFAGEALRKADRLFQAGIVMNGQIVLCKGINDGEELERSIRDLSAYLPCLESVSVVPVGLTRHREGLYPLEPFQKEDAERVLAVIHDWQDRLYREQGTHFIHGGDEWYLLAGWELPEAERYDGYLQLENGVGMMRLLLDEFEEALNEAKMTDNLQNYSRMSLKLTGRVSCVDDFVEGFECNSTEQDTKSQAYHKKGNEMSIVTGKLAYPYIHQLAKRMMTAFPELHIHVYPIINYFFGELITVSGLLTGQDIIDQLKGRELGGKLLLPQNVLRSGEDIFLDDVTLSQLEKALQVPVYIVKSSGHDFVEAILGTVLLH